MLLVLRRLSHRPIFIDDAKQVGTEASEPGAERHTSILTDA